MRCARKAKLRNSIAGNEVLSTENTFLWNENLDDAGT